MHIVDELEARGLVKDISGRQALCERMSHGPMTFYVGYDPTAPSLHVGNLVPTMVMARLRAAGHRALALVGGATGMIGDPSGKSSERSLLGESELEANVAGVRAQLERIIDASAGEFEMVNNRDWFAGIGYIEFLRDVGKHLTINYMMAKESVRARLEDREQGISYTEFSYMLLQAYDFVVLARQHGCLLQIGGSDQWGNITAGIELARKLDGKHLFGMTAPLLLDASGEKMGKTSTGERVWLDPDRTSPYGFYQYWLGMPDADVGRLLRMFSPRPLDEIASIESEHMASPHRREGQRILAEDMTTWVHGADALRRAQKASQFMFGGDLDDLRDSDLKPLLADVPSSKLERSRLDTGLSLIELLVETKLATSKGDARRLLAGGGVYLNNQRMGDDRTVSSTDLATESMMVLRSGKKKYHIVQVL